MPNIEPIVAQQDKVTLRLIGPAAAVWPDSPGAVPEFTVLQNTTMVARPLPVANIPASPDFVSGSYDLRLDDAGDLQFLWPNSTSSDGIPWKSRFDVTGHLQFLEVYFDGELDSVCVIDQTTPDEAQVTVHGDDPWWLLKKAYVRDWIVTQAPRDVIDRGTQLWLPVVVDNFPAGSLNAQWTNLSVTGGTATIGTSGGLYLTTTTTSGSLAGVAALGAVQPTSTWVASCSVQAISASSTLGAALAIQERLVPNTSGTQTVYQIGLNSGPDGTAYFNATVGGTTNTVAELALTVAPSYGLMLECDGEWISAFINGQLVGTVRRSVAQANLLAVELVLVGTTSTQEAIVTGVLVDALQPFLMAGSDKGDYVLPGDITTYPSGGLQARYFNDLDLQADVNQQFKTLNPTRTQAYGGSSPAEYQDQQDPIISGQSPPTGASTFCWSCIWFGSIYLKLSQGNYTFKLTMSNVAPSSVRAWIGKTRFGDQLVDEWNLSTSGVYSFTVSASSLVGTLPYGAGTVARDGWYPMKIEFMAGDTPVLAPEFFLTSSPAAYTDPGGTAIASGSQSTIVPPTSLSPLGMMDQRYQGIAHFDLVQQTLQAVGYHASVEPHQLESGLFPGVLAPRIREGHDTDIILQADRGPRQDGEGILNYSSTLDSTDFASSLQGNGAGVQSGSSGQLQGLIFDADVLTNSLFDAQQWQDFSDAQQPALLNGLLDAQLNLQLEPWQSLSADPTGRPRKAFTWPLPGSIQNMRWRPGDGIMIREPQINVYDTSPRQMMVVTRNLGPFGIQSTQATFANRPRNPAKALKQQFFTATRLQRNYQRQRVAITGNFQTSAIAAHSTDTGISGLALSPGDTIIGATLRVTLNAGLIGVTVNGGSDVSANLGGPWTGQPITINLAAYAVPNANNQFFVQLTNQGASSIGAQYQIVVDVLR